MNRTVKLWSVSLLALSCVAISSIGSTDQAFPRLITGVDELIGYPGAATDTAGIYVILLPETDRAVLLRPLSEAEYGSHMVQAIGPEMIEQQLLATAFVVPIVETQDVAAFSTELTRFLMETVNRISRFTVFSGVAISSP